MYLRAAKTEAEEAGESTEGMADSVSELRSEIMLLTNNRVDIMADAAGTRFKSTYQILKELSAVWGDLQDVTKANLLERLSGKRNSNVTASILENFEVAEDALESSINSAGSAMKANEQYLNSINGKMEQLTASYQALSNAILDSAFIKIGIDAVRLFVDTLNSLNDVLDGLPTGIIAVVAASTALFAAFQAISSIVNKLQMKTAIEGIAAAIMTKLFPSMVTQTTAASGVAAAELAEAAAAKEATAAQVALAEAEVAGAVTAEDAAAAKTLLAEAMASDAAAAKSLSAAQAAATTTSVSFGLALATVSGIFIALGVAIWGVNKYIKWWNENHPTTDDLIDSAKETANELKSVSSELENIKTQIDDIKDKDSLTIADEEDLRKLQATNDELERRRRLLELQSKEDNEKAERSAIKDIRKNESDTAREYNQLVHNYKVNGYSEEEAIAAATSGIIGTPTIGNFNALIKQMDGLRKSREEAIKAGDDSIVEQLNDQIDELKPKIDSMYGSLDELYSKISGNTTEGKQMLDDFAAAQIRLAKLNGVVDAESDTRSVFNFNKYDQLQKKTRYIGEEGATYR